MKYWQITTRKLAIYPKDNRQTREVAAESAWWVRLGADQTISKEVEEELGTTNHLSRTYLYKASPDKNNPVILELHLAYYTGMIDTGAARAGFGALWRGHVDRRRCGRGGGAGVDGGVEAGRGVARTRRGASLRGAIHQPTPSGIKLDGTPVRLPALILDKIEMKITKFSGPKISRIFSGYFFIANGGTVPTGDGVRLLAFDLKSKYAYYMKVQLTSAMYSTSEELAKYAGLFLDENFADLMLCVPIGWTWRRGDISPRTKRTEVAARIWTT